MQLDPRFFTVAVASGTSNWIQQIRKLESKLNKIEKNYQGGGVSVSTKNEWSWLASHLHSEISLQIEYINHNKY